MTMTGPPGFPWGHDYRIRSRHADIYRVPCADGRGFVVAKVARTPGESVLLSLRKEYSALVDVNQRVGAALFDSLPRPLLLLEREGVLFLSGVSGGVLERKLQWEANALWGWLSDAKMRATGAAVGEWLRGFHEITSATEPKGHHHGDYLRELHSNLDRARRVGITGAVLHRVRDQAEAASEPLNRSSVPTAAAHGDFIPQNILFCEGRVGVVDFGSYRAESPVYHDVAAFLAYVTMLAVKPVYCRKALELLASHFLEGYARRLDPNLLRAFVVNAILRITDDAPRRAISERHARRIEDLLLDVSNGTSWFVKHFENCRSL
jgi:hypothetical protein